MSPRRDYWRLMIRCLLRCEERNGSYTRRTQDPLELAVQSISWRVTIVCPTRSVFPLGTRWPAERHGRQVTCFLQSAQDEFGLLLRSRETQLAQRSGYHGDGICLRHGTEDTA